MTIVPKKKADPRPSVAVPNKDAEQHKSKDEHLSSEHRRSPLQCSSATDNVDYSGYNSGDEHTHERGTYNLQWTEQDLEEREIQFEKKINKKGWIIKKMAEDGACLFRAVADQIYGDQDMHSVLRKLCMDYIKKNSDYFSHYVTEDFGEYLKRKSLDHSHGNHIEIQAMSEMFNRPIEVYHYSSEPINIFQGATSQQEPIRLSYHRSVHYNSIVNPFKATVGVGLGLPSLDPGLADRTLLEKAIRISDEDAIEKAMLEDKLLASELEATNEAIEEQVARESYLEWLRENETRAQKRLKRTSSPQPTTASFSQDSESSSQQHYIEESQACSSNSLRQNKKQRTDNDNNFDALDKNIAGTSSSSSSSSSTSTSH